MAKSGVVLAGERIDVFGDVRAFNEACGVQMNLQPGRISSEDAVLALNLIAEELDELEKAVKESDLVEIADALADSIYVTVGLVLRHGIDPDRAMFHDWEIPIPPRLLDRLFGMKSVRDLVSTAERLSDAVNSGALASIEWDAQTLINRLVQMARWYGIPLQAVWDEVQRSNMAKVVDGVVVRDPVTNKILKPDGWTAPDITGVLNGASSR
ncbi:UNVERIFIED_ORG: putative HAD superfamily Cof-like phosphohydrolase [Rhodococcus erythropolis]